jgi:hypothetical protein
MVCLPALCPVCWDDLGMQGEERLDRPLLDAAALAGRLVPAGSMFAFLAEHRHGLFPDAEFADLFPSGRGRPSVPASVMAAVLVLQALHDYSDRETAEAVRCDLRWKVALGLAVDDEGFDASTLVYWRRRLAASERPHRIGDKVRAVVAQTGVLAGRRARVVDSTLLADAVATQDTVTQLIAAIRRVARVVPGAAEMIAAVCTGHDYASPRRPVIDWDDPAARTDLVSGLVSDAHAVVAAYRDAGLGQDGSDAVGLLALVAGQDVEPVPGSAWGEGRWQIAPGFTAPDRMISQVDVQARHARKNRHTRVDGYRAHVCAEPSTGLITDEELTMAAGEANSDPEAAARFVAREHPAAGQRDDGETHAHGPGGRSSEPGEGEDGAGTARWYGDTAYGTGKLRAVIEQAGNSAVIKPKPVKHPAGEDGFTINDFTPDETAGTLTCPAGVTRPIPPSRAVRFGDACARCPLRPRCTTSKTGRLVILHPHDQLLRAARQKWASDPALRKDYSATRPSIERVIAHIATRRGRRIKLRYRGTAKNHAWLKRRTAALNLRTLIGNGLHPAGTAWAIVN